MYDILDEQQENWRGIKVSELPSGTLILANTIYSLYKIKVINKKEIMIQGGWVDGVVRYPQYCPAIFRGSTWGGAAIKVDWIGYKMKMEFIVNNTSLITSRVKCAEVIGDGWKYEMEWPSD